MTDRALRFVDQDGIEFDPNTLTSEERATVCFGLLRACGYVVLARSAQGHQVALIIPGSESFTGGESSVGLWEEVLKVIDAMRERAVASIALARELTARSAPGGVS